MKAGLRVLLVGAVGIAALVSTGISASASNPYYSGMGYDISYPQCNPDGTPSTSLPAGSFGIVGVNHGRPFTTYANTCFSGLVAHASAQGMPAPSLYINTAYSGAYRKNITPYCAQQAQSMAWQIGCSEADTSYTYAGKPTTSAVTMWWLDVEVGNSWSTSNVGLNQAAIQGATDRFFQGGFLVGVYSTSSSWRTITGANQVYTPNNSVAAWLAGANGVCTSSFDASPLWLSQNPNGFDYDNAC